MNSMYDFWGLLTPFQVGVSYLLLSIIIIGWVFFLKAKKIKKLNISQLLLLSLTFFLFISLLIHVGELNDFGVSTKKVISTTLENVKKEVGKS